MSLESVWQIANERRAKRGARLVFNRAPKRHKFLPPVVGGPVPVERKATDTCVYRGDQSGEVECSTCQGVVMLKVYACERHGRCTLAKPSSGMACCLYCADFKHKEPVNGLRPPATAG